MKVKFRNSMRKKSRAGDLTCDVDQPASARHLSTPQLSLDLNSLALIRISFMKCTLKMREAAGWFLTISDQKKSFKVSHVPKSLLLLSVFPSRYLTLLSSQARSSRRHPARSFPFSSLSVGDEPTCHKHQPPSKFDDRVSQSIAF